MNAVDRGRSVKPGEQSAPGLAFGVHCVTSFSLPGTFEHTAVFYKVQTVPLSMMQVKGDSYGNVTAATLLHGRVSGARNHSQRCPRSSGAGVVQLRWQLSVRRSGEGLRDRKSTRLNSSH